MPSTVTCNRWLKSKMHHSHSESLSLLWTKWRLSSRNLQILEDQADEIFIQMINTVFFNTNRKRNNPQRHRWTKVLLASGTSSTTCYTYINKKSKSSQAHRRQHVNILVSFQTVKQTEETITNVWQKNFFNMKGSLSKTRHLFLVKTSAFLNLLRDGEEANIPYFPDKTPHL